MPWRMEFAARQTKSAVADSEKTGLSVYGGTLGLYSPEFYSVGIWDSCRKFTNYYHRIFNLLQQALHRQRRHRKHREAPLFRGESETRANKPPTLLSRPLSFDRLPLRVALEIQTLVHEIQTLVHEIQTLAHEPLNFATEIHSLVLEIQNLVLESQNLVLKCFWFLIEEWNFYILILSRTNP